MVGVEDGVHGNEGQSPGIMGGRTQDFYILQGDDGEIDPGHLQLGVEGCGGYTGNIDLGIQQAIEDFRVGAVDVDVNDAAVSEQAHVGGVLVGTDGEIGRLDSSGDRYPDAIEA